MATGEWLSGVPTLACMRCIQHQGAACEAAAAGGHTAQSLHLCCSTAGLQAMAARGVFYAPRLVDLVDRVVKRIGGHFNAMHLRFEPDMGLDPKVGLGEAAMGAGWPGIGSTHCAAHLYVQATSHLL